MAKSPSHRFGQVIGNLLEEVMQPRLQEFCNLRGLYLDVPGERPGVRRGKRLRWTDNNENSHDLDFVIERNGCHNTQGRPVAFIEAAWRRYTKHSKNKAQEIQGAILPIAEKHRRDKPFLGVILAGEFTDNSVDQLQSLGFRILHVPYSTIIDAFSFVDINADFDETTADEEFQDQVDRIELMNQEEMRVLQDQLVTDCGPLIDQFFEELGQALDRVVISVMILPLSGEEHLFNSLVEAEHFVDKFNEERTSGTFLKYEVIVKYSNGDRIDGSFADKQELKGFLTYVGG